MTSFLQKFQAQTRLRIPMDVAMKWESCARCNGSKDIKQQIANARRSATALKKIASHFANVKPEHRLALDAAANAMQALVSELTPLVPWAVSYKKFCDQARAEQDAANLEAIASARWPSDTDFLFEFSVMQELRQKDGESSFAEWMGSTGRYPLAKKFVCVLQRLADGRTDRERAARTVHENNSSRGHSWGDTQFCGWADYESYLLFRGAVAKAAERAVQTASIQLQHNQGNI